MTQVLSGLALLMIAAASNAFASDDESASPHAKPFRIVAKVGSPSLVGLELEGVVPGIGNWLGIWTGFTHLPIGNGESTVNGEVEEKTKGGLNHFGIGLNFYLPGNASGIYFATGYDRVSAYDKVIVTQSDDKSFVNPTQMISTQLGYKYVGNIFTYSFFGGYGFNFGYNSPDVGADQTILFKKGNWVQAGVSFGLAFPLKG